MEQLHPFVGRVTFFRIRLLDQIARLAYKYEVCVSAIILLACGADFDTLKLVLRKPSPAQAYGNHTRKQKRIRVDVP